MNVDEFILRTLVFKEKVTYEQLFSVNKELLKTLMLLQKYENTFELEKRIYDLKQTINDISVEIYNREKQINKLKEIFEQTTPNKIDKLVLEVNTNTLKNENMI